MTANANISNSVLEIESATKVLGKRRVVDDVTFAVTSGEVVGFLGPNGAGKTTTIRMLLGLSRPTAGECRVLGEVVPGATLHRVGSLIDGPALYPWMTARRNLKALAPGITNPEIDALLDRVDLTHAEGKRASAYSLGMKQRLALAVALAGRPSALVLDEPANGLDPAGIRDFRRILRETANDGCAVLLSSHQLGEVELSCDRVIVLNRGRIVAQGTPSELGALDDGIEIVFADGDPDLVARTLRTLDRYQCNQPAPGVVVVHGVASGAAVSRALAEAGLFPDSVTARAVSLEDRFFSLTEGADA